MRTARLLPVSPGMHCSRGVYLPGGCTCLGGVPAQGCTCPRGVPAQGVYLPVWCTCLGGTCPGGVPCDLSHHAFDVTCMLPPHQLRHINSAPAYILLPGHVTCKACWDTQPPLPREQNDRQVQKYYLAPNFVCGR